MTRFTSLILGLALVPAAHAAESKWARVSTPHFELITTAGERTARKALEHFEQSRQFFLKTHGLDGVSRKPMRIIGFSDPKEYASHRPNSSISAFFISWGDNDTIVIGDIESQDRKTAIHEFTHLLFRRTKIELPLWLDEGLADLYSTLELSRGKVRVGALVPGRLELLQNNRWRPLERVLSTRRDSPEYQGRRHAGLFYSQAWALTHMLNLDERFRGKVGEFIASVRAGTSSSEAFQKVYGLAPQQVEQALLEYVQHSRFNAAIFDVKIKNSSVEPSFTEVSDLESRLILGQLMGFIPTTRKQGKRALGKLAQEYPGDWRVPEARGYVAWIEGDTASARNHFGQSAQLGSTNAAMFYDFAGLSRGSAGPETIIEHLRRAYELDPAYPDVNRQLGFLLMQRGRWDEAIRHLELVEEVRTREEAFQVYFAQALAYFRLRRLDDSRKAAETAQGFAESAKQEGQVAELIRAIGPAN